MHGCALIDGIFAEWLLGDKGYDSNAMIAKAQKQNMQLVIPPKKNDYIMTCLGMRSPNEVLDLYQGVM
jgi:hypothetical protein